MILEATELWSPSLQTQRSIHDNVHWTRIAYFRINLWDVTPTAYCTENSNKTNGDEDDLVWLRRLDSDFFKLLNEASKA